MTLRKLRKAKGYTQQALADSIGINLRQIQKIESGEIDIENITLRNGLKLATALGIDPYTLIAKKEGI